jgi:hypothetical protein
LLFFFLMTVLQRLEPDVMGEEAAGFSIFNKAFCSCRFDADGQELVLPSFVMVIWRMVGFNLDVALRSICSGGVWKLLLGVNQRWLVVSHRPRWS